MFIYNEIFPVFQKKKTERKGLLQQIYIYIVIVHNTVYVYDTKQQELKNIVT